MKRRTLSVMGLFVLFLVGTVVMGNSVAGLTPIDITVDQTVFVKGYMKHGHIFVFDGLYYGDVHIEATFTHLSSKRVFTFDFDTTLNGMIYILPVMKKMPAGMYYMVIHITSIEMIDR